MGYFKNCTEHVSRKIAITGAGIVASPFRAAESLLGAPPQDRYSRDKHKTTIDAYEDVLRPTGRFSGDIYGSMINVLRLAAVLIGALCAVLTYPLSFFLTLSNPAQTLSEKSQRTYQPPGWGTTTRVTERTSPIVTYKKGESGNEPYLTDTPHP